MTLKLSVISIVTLLFPVCTLTLGFLFGGPDGELLPKDPMKCTTESITFNCTVNDIRYSSADLSFMTNNDDLMPENKTDIVDSSTRSLTLANLTMEDYNRNIICCVNGCIDHTDIVGSTQILQVFEYPINVVNFSCIREDWGNNMSCVWSLGQSYKELPEVNVLWRIPSYSGSWNNCLDFNTASKTECKWINSSVGDRFIDVKITVTSQCVVSVSNIFHVNTTLVVKPNPLESNEIQVSPVTSTCLEASWSNPVHNHLKQYKIELSSRWPDVIEPFYRMETNQTRQDNYTHEFCELIPNTEYTVTGSIKPMLEGFWSMGKTAKATTPKDVPFSSPDMTEGGYKWDPSQCETDSWRRVYMYFNSIPEKYQNGEMKAVVARSDIPFHSSELGETEVPADRTQVEVQLDCNTDYNFDVRVRNERGESNKVSKIFIPKANSALKIPELIIETGDRKIYLNWSAEAGNQHTGYTVFWCKKDRGNCKLDTTIYWKKLFGDSNTHILEVDSPEDYLYSVSMETQHGSTGMMWESCIYARNAEPHKHPNTPTVSRSSEDNTLSVYWNKMECESGSPYIVSYRVIYCVWDKKDTNNCSVQKAKKYTVKTDKTELVVPSTQTSVVLEGLKEDTEYGVMIQGVTADGQDGPTSDPAFGKPVNTSLKADAIAGITIGGFFMFVLIVAGAVFIFRFCHRKAKQKLTLPVIDEVPINVEKDRKPSLPNGYHNQGWNHSQSSVNFDRSSQTNLVPAGLTLNDLPQVPQYQTLRQDSEDSGIPEDPMTPRPYDTLTFQETINEQTNTDYVDIPESPGGMKVEPNWRVGPPNGYIRVTTKGDNVPMMPGNAHLSSEINSRLDAPSRDLIVMQVHLPQNQNNFPKTERVNADNNTFVNLDKTDFEESSKSEQDSPTSYVMATMLQNDEVNNRAKEDKHLNNDTVSINLMDFNSPTETKGERVVNHDTDLSNKGHKTLSVKYTDAYVSHEVAQTADTTVYLPQSNDVGSNHDMPPQSNAAVSTGSHNPSEFTATADNTIYLPNSNDVGSNHYMPPQSNAAVSTGSHNPSEFTATADNTIYLPNSNAVGSIHYMPHQSNAAVPTGSHIPSEFTATADTTVYLPNIKSVDSSPSHYMPHQSNAAVSTGSHIPSEFTAIADTDGIVPQEEPQAASINSYLPHNDFATSSDKTDGNISEKEIITTDSINYLPHSCIATSNATTVGNVSHEETQPANTTSYLPNSNFETPNAGTDLHSDSVAEVAEASEGHITQGDLNVADTVNYVSHEEAQTASTTNSLPHSHTETPTSDNYLQHADIATTVFGSHISQAKAVSANSDDYLPHKNLAITKNTDYISQLDVAAANAGGHVHVSEKEKANPITDAHSSPKEAATVSNANYLPHEAIAISNTFGYLPHGDVVGASEGGHVHVSEKEKANPMTDTHSSHKEEATVSNADYLPHEAIAISNTSSYLPHADVAGAKTQQDLANIAFDENGALSEETSVYTHDYSPHEMFPTAANVTISDGNSPVGRASSNDDSNSDETNVSNNTEPINRNQSYVQSIAESSGNTGLYVSKNITRTDSLNDHDKDLKRSALDSSKSDCANYTHNGTTNCDIQTDSSANKNDYISHESTIIQNTHSPNTEITEETVTGDLEEEDKNSCSDATVSNKSEQNDCYSKSLEDKSNNNLTVNLNKTAPRIIPNKNGYVVYDQQKKACVGQITAKPMNGYVTSDQMQPNFHNQNPN